MTIVAKLSRPINVPGIGLLPNPCPINEITSTHLLKLRQADSKMVTLVEGVAAELVVDPDFVAAQAPIALDAYLRRKGYKLDGADVIPILPHGKPKRDDGLGLRTEELLRSKPPEFFAGRSPRLAAAQQLHEAENALRSKRRADAIQARDALLGLVASDREKERARLLAQLDQLDAAATALESNPAPRSPGEYHTQIDQLEALDDPTPAQREALKDAHAGLAAVDLSRDLASARAVLDIAWLKVTDLERDCLSGGVQKSAELRELVAEAQAAVLPSELRRIAAKIPGACLRCYPDRSGTTEPIEQGYSQGAGINGARALSWAERQLERL